MTIGSIRPKAVLLGLAVDVGGSLLVGIIAALVVGIWAATSHNTSPAQVRLLAQNVPVKVAGLVGTLLATTFGGYVAARMGRPAFMANAFAMGALSK